MRIGVFSFNTEYGVPADRLALAAEERGFESFWVPEHTHIPVPPPGEGDPRTGMPASVAGTFLPEEYRHMSCPFVTLAAAAAVTRRIRLGTCICLVNQHHPINLAKHVSTLDQLSRGRFILGVGAGWNKQEMAHHGVKFDDRWKQAVERIRALRAIWSEEKVSFRGDYVRFEDSWQYPKPLQHPGPPIVLGTLDTAFGRNVVARHGEGWLPLTFDVDRVGRSIESVRARMKNHGRDPQTLEVSLFFLADELQDTGTLHKAQDLGVKRIIFRLPASNENATFRVLDRYANAAL